MSKGRTAGLFLGKSACHLLKWLAVSPAGLSTGSTVTIGGSGRWLQGRGFFCAGHMGGGYRAGSIVSLKRCEKKGLLFPTWI